MNDEKLQKMMEAIGNANIHVAGDFVIEKHVGTEVANVEAGGIVNITNGEDINAVSSSVQVVEERPENEEEIFHFIHPTVEAKDEWNIHNEVKRLVTKNGLQEICYYLKEMRKENKILLPQSPSSAYIELVRMGMPVGEGYNEKTFYKYYMK